MQYKIGSFGVFDIDEIENPPVTLLDGGVERRYRESYYFNNRKRNGFDGYMIQYTLSGSGVFEKNGVKHQMTPEKAFAVRLPEDSCYYLPESGEAWEFFYLHFSGEGIRPYMDRLEAETGGVFSLDFSGKAVKRFLQLQEKICGGYLLKRYEASEFMFCFICEVLQELEHAALQRGASPVEQAVDLMRYRYASIESVGQIAEWVEISPEHFCRIFKQEMKMTPGQYLVRLRIQASMTDLLSTDDTLEVIAQRNGFSNANYFGKVFKKYVGMTPARYRSSRN